MFRWSNSFYAYCLIPGMAVCSQTGEDAAILSVDTNPAHELDSFDPDSALGSIDVLSRLDIDLVYSPQIIEESLSAGWGEHRR